MLAILAHVFCFPSPCFTMKMEFYLYYQFDVLFIAINRHKQWLYMVERLPSWQEVFVNIDTKTGKPSGGWYEASMTPSGQLKEHTCNT